MVETIPVTEGERLWSIDDLCDFLNVTKRTVYRWRRRGEGPPSYAVIGQLRYRPTEVHAWLEEQGDRTS